MTILQTPRLELIPATAELLRLEIKHPSEVGTALNAAIPEHWPPDEVKGVLEFFAGQMDAGVTGDGWGVYYWVRKPSTETAAGRVLVGSGGFMSKPNKDGIVEIGYGTLAEFQGLGYATEAVQGLTHYALSRAVVAVVGDALPENAASVRVLQKNGFVEIGDGAEAGTRRFKRVAEGEIALPRG